MIHSNSDSGYFVRLDMIDLSPKNELSLNLLDLVLVNSSGEISCRFSFVRSVFFVESCFGVAVDGILTLMQSLSVECCTRKVALDSLPFYSSSPAKV